MAAFTSTQTGNWDDGGTWGNTSPGVAGTDFPGADGDTASIVATHVVTYDAGTSTVQWGDIDVYGTLSFPTDADSDLIIDEAALFWVYSGGVVNIGTSSTPIGAAYKARLLFEDTTADNIPLRVDTGGEFNSYGDEDYYGDKMYAEQDSDWTSGTTLYITGDISSDWNVDDIIVIHKNTTYSAYATDTLFYTIASLTYDSGNTRTALVINESAPGVSFYADNYGWTNRVMNMSRNVFIGVDSTTATAHASIYFYNTVATCHHTQFNTIEDFYATYNKYNVLVGCSFFRVGNPVLANCTVTDCVVYGAATGITTQSDANTDFDNVYFFGSNSGTSKPLSIRDTDAFVYFIGCATGITSGNQNFNCYVISCNYVISSTVSGYTGTMFVYNATRAIFTGMRDLDVVLYASGCLIITDAIGIGRISGEIDNSTNTTSFSSDYICIFTGKISGPITDAIYNLYAGGAAIFENAEIDGDLRPYRARTCSGVINSLISGDTGFQTPPSGNSWVLEMVPDTSAAMYRPLRFSIGTQKNQIWATTTDTNLALEIYPASFSTSLSTTIFSVYVTYIDNATNRTYTREYLATPATYTNGSWHTLDIAIAPAEDGYVTWTVDLYDDGGTVLVDPIPVIT